MAEQKRKESKSTKAVETQESDAPSATLSKKGEHLKKEMDAMLDEIDDILEENAEEFVASYVQRGGQ
jgi:ubiquitin-like protein Pup